MIGRDREMFQGSPSNHFGSFSVRASFREASPSASSDAEMIFILPLFLSFLLSKEWNPTFGRFLHITDFHLDPFYKVGAGTESACHRPPATNSEPRAGKYGNRGCDTPISMARRLITHIGEHQSDFDFILLTGDLARHDNDIDHIPKTEAEHVSVHWMVRKAMEKHFPSKPVIFSIGNNDLFDHNQLGEGIETPELKAYFRVWRHYIPKDQWKTFATSGYYQLSHPSYPLDIISLNTMYFYQPNELVVDCSVKGSSGHRHLKWLKEQLKSCRTRGASAYLVGHVAPSARQYYPGCLSQYVKLTRKYSDVIHGQFFGHSNYDEFFLDKSESELEPTKRKPKTFGLIAPSVVPILNTAYRIFEYQTQGTKFGQLLDYEQYYVDLDEANGSDSFRVRLEYTAQDEYGPGPLSARFFRKLQNRLSVESKLMKRYQLHRLVMCQECPADKLSSPRVD